ncbi:winged helix-turn-helix domain-containing protein [Subtercola endophyticus]|uniref:winged helix-turn-helix domain-containing protein n=1 Tax=Subtercola endophyticus TaxID=2895559 RepID=UPI001E4BB81C|nr:winged helix-turn-helix domain-containing protein [Subtercola endophyticus]UFS58044.1 winged helix-turn-helix domain-containing protein [Subtercola endophyticus]
MSIAQLKTPLATSYTAPAVASRAAHPAAATGAAAASAPVAGGAAPHIRAVPAGTEARGFVLYVGIDEEKAEHDGTELGSIVAQIKALVAQLAPSSETYAAVALAPRGSGGRDVDVVRLALQDPAALAKHRQTPEPADRAHDGVVIDLSRKRVLLDNESANLTYKEFELLQYLVLREGRTIERAELISALWSSGDDDIPNERTIDVHVRRLRSKLGSYEDIVRTVRGVGYRFDRHADVSVRQTSTPSPDLF